MENFFLIENGEWRITATIMYLLHYFTTPLLHYFTSVKSLN